VESLAELLTEGSFAPWGKTAATRPVHPALLPQEYVEHIERKHCPARECKGLFLYQIVAENLHGLHDLPQEVPGAMHFGSASRSTSSTQQPAPKVRHLLREVPLRGHREGLREVGQCDGKLRPGVRVRSPRRPRSWRRRARRGLDPRPVPLNPP